MQAINNSASSSSLSSSAYSILKSVVEIILLGKISFRFEKSIVIFVLVSQSSPRRTSTDLQFSIRKEISVLMPSNSISSGRVSPTAKSLSPLDVSTTFSDGKKSILFNLAHDLDKQEVCAPESRTTTISLPSIFVLHFNKGTLVFIVTM